MKPTIIICPGAWPIIGFFDPIIKLLEASGHPTKCVNPSEYRTPEPSIPSSLNPDCTYLRTKVLEPLIERETDIVLFMHSYGGVYGASSLEGLSKKERSMKGLKGGVTALVFVAAFIALTGTSVNSAMGIDRDNIPKWLYHEKSTDMVVYKSNYAKAMLFHELPDEEAEKAAALLPKQPYSCFSTPAHWDPYNDPLFKGCSAYIFTGADRVVPLELQQQFVKEGGIRHTYLLEDCSHSAHIERPSELVKAFTYLLGKISDSV